MLFQFLTIYEASKWKCHISIPYEKGEKRRKRKSKSKYAKMMGNPISGLDPLIICDCEKAWTWALCACLYLPLDCAWNNNNNSSRQDIVQFPTCPPPPHHLPPDRWSGVSLFPVSLLPLTYLTFHASLNLETYYLPFSLPYSFFPFPLPLPPLTLFPTPFPFPVPLPACLAPCHHPLTWMGSILLKWLCLCIVCDRLEFFLFNDEWQWKEIFIVLMMISILWRFICRLNWWWALINMPIILGCWLGMIFKKEGMSIILILLSTRLPDKRRLIILFLIKWKHFESEYTIKIFMNGDSATNS